VLSTDEKGAIAEAAIAYHALRLGVAVSRPLGDQPYDLIFETAIALVRVQCKWACRYGDVIVVRRYRNRRTADWLLRQVYSRERVDAFAVYCDELDTCYYLPFDAVPPRGYLHLRLARTRNNQKARISWAKDFEFAATLGALHGAVAQLGERGAGSAQVTGSSPVGSTREAASPRRLPLSEDLPMPPAASRSPD
jgi:hypothetical protein